MTLAPPVPGLRLVLEDVDLRAGALTDDLGHNLGGLEFFTIGKHFALLVDDEKRSERHLAVAAQAFDVDDVTLTHLCLLSARADDRVHARRSFKEGGTAPQCSGSGIGAAGPFGPWILRLVRVGFQRGNLGSGSGGFLEQHHSPAATFGAHM